MTQEEMNKLYELTELLKDEIWEGGDSHESKTNISVFDKNREYITEISCRDFPFARTHLKRARFIILCKKFLTEKLKAIEDKNKVEWISDILINPYKVQDSET